MTVDHPRVINSDLARVRIVYLYLSHVRTYIKSKIGKSLFLGFIIIISCKNLRSH